jgi:hypothetical protein
MMPKQRRREGPLQRINTLCVKVRSVIQIIWRVSRKPTLLYKPNDVLCDFEHMMSAMPADCHARSPPQALLLGGIKGHLEGIIMLDETLSRRPSLRDVLFLVPPNIPCFLLQRLLGSSTNHPGPPRIHGTPL